MTSNPRADDDSDEDAKVPPEVLEGIEDVAEGRTADGDDLDEAIEQ